MDGSSDLLVRGILIGQNDEHAKAPLGRSRGHAASGKLKIE